MFHYKIRPHQLTERVYTDKVQKLSGVRLPVQFAIKTLLLPLAKQSLLDTVWALILPALFAPLGTFILTQSFKFVPNSVLEAAMLDSCGIPSVTVRIMLPMNKNGLVCTVLLSLLDCWNMVEQPITRLKGFRVIKYLLGNMCVFPLRLCSRETK